MTPDVIPIDAPETWWRRWLRIVAAFEEAMDATYDDVQDRRMDRIEAELGRLRSELSERPSALTRV